jgi:hypothetical protein
MHIYTSQDRLCEVLLQSDKKEFLEKKKNSIWFYSEPPTSYAPKNIPKRSPSANIYA